MTRSWNVGILAIAGASLVVGCGQASFGGPPSEAAGTTKEVAEDPETSDTDSATKVTPPVPDGLSCTLTVDKPTVAKDATVTLNYTVNGNATSATLNGVALTDLKSGTSSEVISAAKTFELVVADASAQATCSVTVSVSEPEKAKGDDPAEKEPAPYAFAECTPDKFSALAGVIAGPVIDIDTAAGLAAITSSHRYQLTADIDLTGDWEPINADHIHLNGNGHSIRGLSVNIQDGNGTSSHHDAAGLFGHLERSSVIDLKIVSPVLKARYSLGAIAGVLDRACIEKVTISDAVVQATYQAGVLAGFIENGSVTIRNVTANATILEGPDAQTIRTTIGAAGSIGGLIGGIQDGGAGSNSIRDATLTFDITADTPPATSGVGGLVGTSYATVLVTDVTATVTMHCLSQPCERGGRYVGFSTKDLTLQNTTVNLTKTDTWTAFKDD